MIPYQQHILRFLATFSPAGPGPTVTDIRAGVDHYEDMATMWEALIALQAADHITKYQGDGPWRFQITPAGRQEARP
jgi:hypothetical protein